MNVSAAVRLMLAAAGLLLVLAPSTLAATRGNGALLFQSNPGTDADIFVMAPDGSGLTNITNAPRSDFAGSWSPDGKKIVFTSFRVSAANAEIYVMDADGGNPTRLTTDPAVDQDPSWSPDGSKIVFLSTRDGNNEIYTMNADGSNQTRITNNTDSDFEPEWSPAGSTIAFTSDRDGNAEIYTMNADGSGQTRRTTNAGNDQSPKWSPDGSQIVFSRNFDVYTMNADGSSLVNRSNSPGSDSEPGWSPDGKKLVWVSDREGNFEVYTANVDGSGVTRLTFNTAVDADPDWGSGDVPEEAKDKRPTATQVICNRGPNPTDTSECTATVGDAGAPPRPTPKGKVSFTTTTGSFALGSSCTLQPTPLSPGVASCSVTYYPSGGGFPEVTATYEGDDTHASSSGATSFLLGVPVTTAAADTPGAPPNPYTDSECNALDPNRGSPRIEDEQARVPERERGVFNCLGYWAEKGFRYAVNGAGQVVIVGGGTVIGVALPAGGAALGLEAGPAGAVAGGVTGGAMTLEYVVPLTAEASKALSEATARALADPPDPKFRVIVRPKAPSLTRVRRYPGVNARTSRALLAYFREEQRIARLSQALGATLDKAGGARVAGDRAWEGRQMRAAVAYATRLATSLDRAVTLRRAAARLARRSAPLKRSMASTAAIRARLARVRRTGLNRVERRYFARTLKLSTREIAQMRRDIGALRPGQVHRSVAAMLSHPAAANAYAVAAAAYRDYVQIPQIVALTRQ